MSIGEKILRFRAKHDLSQQAMADILGVGLNMVFRYEHGLSLPSAVNQIRFQSRMEQWEAGKNEND